MAARRILNSSRWQVNLAVLAPDLVKLLRGCKAEVNPQLAELAREEELLADAYLQPGKK